MGSLEPPGGGLRRSVSLSRGKKELNFFSRRLWGEGLALGKYTDESASEKVSSPHPRYLDSWKRVPLLFLFAASLLGP